MERMSRREFMRTGLAGMAAAGLGSRLAAEERKPRLVVATGGGPADSDQATEKRLAAALERYGGLGKLVKGKKVLIKINATDGGWRDANTSSQCTGALLKLVKANQPVSITVLGQEWGGWRAKRKGLPTLAEVIKARGATIKQLPHYWVKTSKDSYKLIQPQPPLWKELMVAKDLFEPGTVLLNLARLKSHPHCVYTGVIKNIIGLTRCMYGFHMVDDTKWPKNAGDPANSDGWPVFPRKLAFAHKMAVGPLIALNILDANEPCFGWRGPGRQRIHTFPAAMVIVGNDPLAMDIYGCTVRFTRTKANYLKTCAELGVGEGDLGKVKIEKVNLG